MTRPELLLPAGDFEKLKFAFEYGADAVYAGVPMFSLRARENDFNVNSIAEAIDYTRKLSKKIYLTVNIVPHNVKIEPLKKAIAQMAELKPDAFIMADPGVIHFSKKIAPQIPIHLSVQANNVNWAAIEFWKEVGVQRVILSREISIKEMKTIHEQVPDMELEAFVHGSICIAYSGRCLLSNYMSFRDANQGTCSHSCRWKYRLHEESNNADQHGVFDENYQPIKGTYYLEEVTRPGELMEIDEDENGTYIMNSRDICAVEYLQDLMDAGICSFKVEGRSKTLYYAASVARTYRKAIDDVMAGKRPSFEYVKELAKTSNRGFITGFLVSNPKERAQFYEKNATQNTHLFSGIIREVKPNNWGLVEAKNRIDIGDEVEVISPDETQDFTQNISTIQSITGENLTSAHGGAGCYWIQFDQSVKPNMLLRSKIAGQILFKAAHDQYETIDERKIRLAVEEV